MSVHVLWMFVSRGLACLLPQHIGRIQSCVRKRDPHAEIQLICGSRRSLIEARQPGNGRLAPAFPNLSQNHSLMHISVPVLSKCLIFECCTKAL
jgi:hypothetical protein